MTQPLTGGSRLAMATGTQPRIRPVVRLVVPLIDVSSLLAASTTGFHGCPVRVIRGSVIADLGEAQPALPAVLERWRSGAPIPATA